jgi:pyridoxamine 5'-phosphate oxidase
VSQQSSVISSRKLLELQWEQIKQRFADGEVPLPSGWGGYRVVPEEVEFWQGGENRLHDRFRYRRLASPSGPSGRSDGSPWIIERLAP